MQHLRVARRRGPQVRRAETSLRDVGRDPAEIEVTALLGPVGPDTGPDTVVRQAEAFGAVGVHTVMVGAVGAEPARWLEETMRPAISRLNQVETKPI